VRAVAEALPRHSGQSRPTLVGVAGVVLEIFCEGVVWWAGESILVVADLHLEKGSAFARRGQMVPPYDTGETLNRLARVIAFLQPATVIALGDSFHDDGGASRMSPGDRSKLSALQVGRDWIWIAGNHDPVGPEGVSGACLEEIAIGPITFRHEPSFSGGEGEMAGHLHPSARVFGRGKSVRRRCFVGDGRRLILPAFGAYTGGLDLGDKAFDGLFDASTLRVFMLGDGQIYPVGLRSLRR
jgi:DNA ligase-associated metallophosphoesterase